MQRLVGYEEIGNTEVAMLNNSWVEPVIIEVGFFSINANGELIYDFEPKTKYKDFAINASGELVLTYTGTQPAMEINASGELIYG